MSGVRRTEPTAWLVAPRGGATLLDYVPSHRTDILARWRAAGLLQPAAAPVPENAPPARLVLLPGAERRPAA